MIFIESSLSELYHSTIKAFPHCPKRQNATNEIIITKLEKTLDKINNNKMNKMLDNIELFLEHIGKDISNDKYFEILEFYLKKNSKIKNLLLDEIDETELNYNLLNKTPELFVDWIFTK